MDTRGEKLKEYKNIKGLHNSQNLRDSITKNELETELEKPIVTSGNYIDLTNNET